MKKLMTMLVAFIALLVCILPASAAVTYSQGVTNVSGVTIPGATHALGCPSFSVVVRDATNVKQPKTFYTWAVNQSTYDVTVTFNAAFTGSVNLQGCFSLTYAATDWQVTAGPSSVTVCGSCSASNYAARDPGGMVYVATYSFSALLTGNGSGTLYAYIDPVTLNVTFATTGPSSDLSLAGAGRLAGGASGYPTGAVPLGHVVYASGAFGTVTDDRPSW